MNKVAVLIPHYNNPTGLKKSLNSISTIENVDVVIVDDGSHIKFGEDEVKNHFSSSGNVFFLYLDKNKGIEEALNTGLQYIKEKKYTYTARLDCDDLCAESRFAIQESFLDENPDIYLVGSFVEAISPEGQTLYSVRMPTTHQLIKNKMYFNSMFIHPTVMFRTEAINDIGFYPTNYPAAEDYAFFFQFVKNYKTAIIPKNLVKIQIDDTGISAKKRKKQVLSRINIIKENFYFGYYPIVGLTRSIILLYIPRDILKFLKMKFMKRNQY